MYALPAESITTPHGLASSALVAAPPSPQPLGGLLHSPPSPATVLISPVPATTSRTFSSSVSAIYTFPAESTATPSGPFSWALVAGPPSPQPPPLQAAPSPAIRVIVPAGDTIRTSLSPQSAMYTSPAESTATPLGALSSALVAGPLSPQPPGALLHAVPLPAIRLIVYEGSALAPGTTTSRATTATSAIEPMRGTRQPDPPHVAAGRSCTPRPRHAPHSNPVMPSKPLASPDTRSLARLAWLTRGRCSTA